MPIGDFEREVLRLIAANRNPDSFVGGATVLNQATGTLRTSEDIDVFHDTQESLNLSMQADVSTLGAAGFEVEPTLTTPTFGRAWLRRGGLQTKVEWVNDSPFVSSPLSRIWNSAGG